MVDEGSSVIVDSGDLPESNAYSFIVKVWLEETANQTTRALWRGHITHVLTGERRYLQDLDQISAFIAPYLKEMGVKLDERP